MKPYPEPLLLKTEPQPARAETLSHRTIAASVQGLSKNFGAASVLKDISFDVAEGESLVLLGASGSGKTTILRIIAGLERANSGRVHLHGEDVTDLPARERGVGVIFQSYALFPRMTVEQNISYGLRIRKRSRKEIQETVDRLLALVHLEEHRRKYPSQLSGGQQQRVAIARTLAYNPQVLLLDEPFGALDAHTRMRLRREINGLLKQLQVPAIFITHDQEEALELGDRIAVLNAGHLEQIGTPAEVYNCPATEYVATFLGAANLLLGVARRGMIEIGSIAIPAPLETAKFREGQSTKLIFRPEDVALSRNGDLPEGSRLLCKGVIEQIQFVGAYERLTVSLDLNVRRLAPSDPALYNASDRVGDKRTGIPISVTRPKSEASIAKLAVGDQVTVGLRSFSVLPNYTLATERGSRMIES